MLHCGHCLREVRKKDVKYCGGCICRAYCGRDCQRNDWAFHKLVCKFLHGEEDRDWEVRKISKEKGLGIVALRDMQVGFMIMAERVYTDPTEHPMIAELEPKDGSLKEKFDRNKVECIDAYGGSYTGVSLRLSRINHSCDSNAYHFSCHDGMKVVMARKPIKRGTEICIDYIPLSVTDISFRTLQEYDSYYFSRKMALARKWKIVCGFGCKCDELSYDEKYQTTMIRIANMVDYIQKCGKESEYTYLTNCLWMVNELVKLQCEGLYADVDLISIHYLGFQAGVMSTDTLNEGINHGRKAYELTSKLFFPLSREVEMFRDLYQNPHLYSGYLRYDKIVAAGRGRSEVKELMRELFQDSCFLKDFGIDYNDFYTGKTTSDDDHELL